DATLVHWPLAGARTSVRLPCAPRALAAVGNDAAGVCAGPLRVVRLAGTSPPLVDLASRVVAGDEAISSDDVVPNWSGAVDGKWIASLRPPSGTSVDAEISANSVIALSAATTAGCERMHSGLGFWRLGKRVVGTRVVSTAELENVELSNDLRHVRSLTV